MKTKSPLKIALIASIIIAIVLGSGLFIASKKLNPEEVKKILISSIEKALPHAEVKTKDLDFSLGFTSSVNIYGIDIIYKSKHSKYELIKINQVSLKIPFWSLVFGGGKIELVVKSPRINYVEFSKLSNWQRAMGSSSKNNRKIKKEKIGKDNNIGLPTFLAGSELNISLFGSQVDYRLRDKSTGKIKIAKMLLKDVGVKSITGFELKSHMTVLEGSDQETSLDLLIIGESSLFKWIKEKKLDIRTNIKITNIKNKMISDDLKKIYVDAQISIDEKLNYIVDYTGSIAEKNTLSGRINNKRKFVEFSKLDIKLNVDELLKIIKHDSGKSPLSTRGNENILVSGSLLFGEKLIPNLKIKLDRALKIEKEGLEADIDLKSKIEKNRISANVKVKTFSGVIVNDLHMPIDWNNLNFKKFKPLQVKVVASDLKVPSSFFDSAEDENTETEIKKDKSPIILLPMNLILNLNRVNLGGANINGEANAIVTRDKVVLTGKKIAIDKGNVNFKVVSLLKNMKIQSTFNTTVNSVNLKSFDGFIPKASAAGISGIASGSVSGDSAGSDYSAKVTLNLKDGKLLKVNLQEYVGGLIEKLGPLKDKIGNDKLKINGEFKSFVLQANLNQHTHTFSKVNFVSKDNNLSVNAKGKIKILGKSLINTNMNFSNSKIGNVLKKELGSTILPVTLTGRGYLLKPDYSKAVKIIAKKSAKVQVKKQAKKQIKKLFKNNENAKKLLKNFFK